MTDSSPFTRRQPTQLVHDLLPEILDDVALLTGGTERLGFTPSRKQREAAVDRLRGVVFEKKDDGMSDAESATFIPSWQDDTGEAMTGAALISAERQRQMDQEGWTPEHDDEHTKGEIAAAAASYTLGSSTLWPWGTRYYKPGHDPVQRLAKAGALIAAEIDRLIRIEERRV